MKSEGKDKFEKFLDERFEKPFFQLRYSILLVVISSLLAAISLFMMGAYAIIKPIVLLFQHQNIEKAELEIIKSIDLLLFGIIMLIFSFGIYDLFVSKLEPARRSGARPNWMKYKSVDDLKNQLIKVINIILVIYFFQIVTDKLDNVGNLDYTFLVLPIGVVLISFASKLMHTNDKDE
jgi:uncharacterized membrane protein YqhA